MQLPWLLSIFQTGRNHFFIGSGSNELEVMNRKKEQGIAKIEILFKEWYPLLLLTSFQIVRNKEVAKDIVQDFFLYYWQHKSQIHIESSLKAYAVKAIKNMSLLHVKADKKKADKTKLLQDEIETVSDFVDQIEIVDNNNVLNLLNKLPDKRKDIFISSVVQGYSYKEIAQMNGISVNTVKTQIKRAYAYLRSEVVKGIILLLSIVS